MTKRSLIFVLAAALAALATTPTLVDLATQVKNVLPASHLPGASVCIPGSFAAQTDAATITWAIANQVCANASLVFTTDGGSRTLNITGLVNGGSYVLTIQQDSSGVGEGLLLGSGCVWKVSGNGGGTITPSIGANAIDVLAFTYDGANCYLNFARNFD